MKNRVLYILVFIMALTGSLSAQTAIGSWQAHLAYSEVTYAVPGSDRIYVLGSGALYSYDPEDNSITTYDKTNLLYDQTISYIEYCKEAKCLVIVYSNYNIDLLYDNEKVYNIPSYMDKNMSNQHVNRVIAYGKNVYLCTGFGIVDIDVEKAQVANTYVLDKEINGCAVKDKVIYAVTEEGLIAGNQSDNLLDAANWREINPTVYSNILLFDNHLFLINRNGGNENGIYLFDEKSETTALSASGDFSIAYCSNNQMIISNRYAIRFYTSYDVFHYWFERIEGEYLRFSSICGLNNQYYAALDTEGLQVFSLDLSDSSVSFTLQEKLISPNGPIRNLAAYMRQDNNRILVCGGGYTTNRLNLLGTITQYKDGKWTSFEEGLDKYTGQAYRDVGTIAVNPSDSSHCFASSYGEGIYEFKNGEFVELYTYKNSSLESRSATSPDRNIRISGLNFDKSGNLWALNMGVDEKIKIRKASGEWISLFYSELKENFGLPNRSLIDSRGWVWIACTMNNNGVFCIDTNGTLENTADDRTRLRSSYTNQDGTTVSGDSEALRVYSLAEDRDGLIWIGTAQGPLLVSNPSKWFDNDFRITQVKIARNDGTNLADYLLSGERINAIAIDGANRKWFGTQNNGIYLVSADGTEEIQHFTISNSPLLSNTVQSIAILPETGEVFIGTDKGINSYQSDATEAGESFGSDVHVFPNPVRSDYTGVITVKGLAYDSDIKIVDAGGHIVCEGRSNGGLFTWDGYNQNGKRVSSGVYMVLAATSDGSEGVVTKIAVIR